LVVHDAFEITLLLRWIVRLLIHTQDKRRIRTICWREMITFFTDPRKCALACLSPFVNSP